LTASLVTVLVVAPATDVAFEEPESRQPLTPTTVPAATNSLFPRVHTILVPLLVLSNICYILFSRFRSAACYAFGDYDVYPRVPPIY